MEFISTRNKNEKVSAAQAIVAGLSRDGGLYVPKFFPLVPKAAIENMVSMSYAERAAFIVSQFFTELDGDKILASCKAAYSRFDGDPAPVVKVDDGIFVMELWHGPTHAFKDIALTLLPHLMTASKLLIGDKHSTLILVATSGDTGKAALEGFKDVEGTDIIVLYPCEGVSDLQKLQMMTTTGSNVEVIGIEGNFDDAQSAVKKIFGDESIKGELEKKGYALSSANSINWGRLMPQIAYYFSAYADLLDGGQIKMGEPINFCVPSGNFGNILAGWYAKQMGLPVGKLICASNKNNVLTDFFSEGEYSTQRPFHKTTSPSMDILVSSNLERLIFEISGRDDKLTATRMESLKATGTYSITKAEKAALAATFFAGYAEEDEVAETLSDFFEEYGYIADPHTAVAIAVHSRFTAQTEDEIPTVIVSTASPYKFAADVLNSIGIKPNASPFKNLTRLEDETALPVPDSLSELASMPKLHTRVIDKADVEQAVLEYKRG